MSKCSECPYKFYPLLTGDCPKIEMLLMTISHPEITIAGPGPNQFCTMSCPGSKQEIEITTCKFFKIPDIYWRRRYLIERMGCDSESIYRS